MNDDSLVTRDVEKAINLALGDNIFTCEWDIMASTTKARQYGFESFAGSEYMFLRILTEMAEARMIPPLWALSLKMIMKENPAHA